MKSGDNDEFGGLMSLVSEDSRDGFGSGEGHENNRAQTMDSKSSKEAKTAEQVPSAQRLTDSQYDELFEDPDDRSDAEAEDVQNVPADTFQEPLLPPGVTLKPHPAAQEAHRKHQADPNDPNWRKRPRKSYSDEAKAMLVRADASGGRKEYLKIARYLNMPVKTADNIIRLSRQTNPDEMPHDRRHDRSVHTGFHTKVSDKHKELIVEWLHMNGGLTMRQIRTYLNKEILREIVEEKGVDLGIEFDGDFDMNDCLEKLSSKSSEVAALYKKQSIKSDQTILNALKGMAYTKKHTVPEKTTVNSPQAKAARLSYAKALKTALTDPGFFFVFIDEMPYYLTMRRTHGYAEKGKRAVVKVPPTSDMAFRTQVAMAVNPSHGLIFGDCYPPEKVTREGKSGNPWRTTWNRAKFLVFLNDLLQAIFDMRDLLQGQRVIIVMDNAPEHGKKGKGGDLIRPLANYRRTKDALVKEGGDLRVLKMPPNSPQLNLCEYYNRTLRTNTTVARHEREVDAALNAEFNHGEKIENRINILTGILRAGLEKLKHSHPQTGSVFKMMSFIDKVIASGGELDMHEPM